MVVLATALRRRDVDRRRGQPPSLPPVGVAFSPSSSLPSLFLSLSLSRSHCIPLGSLSRALLFRYYRHPRSYTPANCPSHLDQLSLSLSLFLSLIPLLFSLPVAPATLSHPMSPTLRPGLTLSRCSSAKTSIRLSPVAPRYTDPSRASRRAPLVPRASC